MGQILKRSAGLLNIKIDDPTCESIASRCRHTPRIANRLLKRVRDYSEVKHDGLLDSAIAESALEMLAIDHLGLNHVDRRLLETMIDKFAGGPVGITTLAAATQEEISTIEDIHEPFLLQLGFLQRTPRGRVVTERAYQHLGLIYPDKR